MAVRYHVKVSGSETTGARICAGKRHGDIGYNFYNGFSVYFSQSGLAGFLVDTSGMKKVSLEFLEAVED